MKISNLIVDKEKCKLYWMTGEKTVSKRVENIIIATINKREDYIYVEIGRNFIADSVLYILADGTELFSYSKLTGVVKWRNESSNISLSFNGVHHADYYIFHKIIIVLTVTDTKRILQGFNNNGECLFRSIPNTNIKPLYLSSVNNKPTVVCEADADQYGRKDWHYTINLKDGSLRKENLAY